MAIRGAKTHGVRAIQRSSRALDRKGKDMLRGIRRELKTPEGIQAALLHRAALGLVMLGVIESYAEQQAAAGVPLDEMPILKAWPSFQNSCVRALRELRSTAPAATSGYEAELKRVEDVLASRPAYEPPLGQEGGTSQPLGQESAGPAIVDALERPEAAEGGEQAEEAGNG